jgi:hypothetical protein
VASGVASPFLRNDVTAARSHSRTSNAQLLRARDFGIWSVMEPRRTDVVTHDNEGVTVDVADLTSGTSLGHSQRHNEAMFDFLSFGEMCVGLATHSDRA